MAGEQTSGVVVQDVKGANVADVNVSLADQNAAKAAVVDPTTAVTLGVTDAEFTKYYNAETKAYNWQGHAHEADFRALRAAQGMPGETAAAAKATAAKPIDVKTAPVTTGVPQSEAQEATIISKAGLDINALEDQILDSGDIDQKAYAALESIGFPNAMVKDYIVSITDRAAGQVGLIMDAFGGDENLAIVQKYAQEKYTMKEMEDLDRKLSDVENFQSTVDMLKHGAGIIPGSTGTPVNTPNSAGGGGGNVVGYANEAEMVMDMRSKKYAVDPAFRAIVTEKVKAAKFGATNPRLHTAM